MKSALRWLVALSSFMKIGSGFQAILTFYFSNQRGRNIDINNERNL
jgi:hypothetical protein